MEDGLLFLEIKKLREDTDYSWADIAQDMNDKFQLSLSPDTYRKKYSEMSKGYDLGLKESAKTISGKDEMTAEEFNKETIVLQQNLKKERIRLSDERASLNRTLREIARAERYMEEFKKSLIDSKTLHALPKVVTKQYDKEALLMISDAHAGAECRNNWNEYDVDIFKERMAILIQETIERCSIYGIKKLNVTELGDAIEGLIHVTTRIENMIDVVEQTKLYSEVFTEAIEKLSEAFEEVHVHMTLGNHSRVSPNKKDSLDKESFENIISWYVKSHVTTMENVFFHENNTHEEIIELSILGNTIVGVHGHKHNPQTVDKVLTTMLKYQPDYILMGHRHTFVEREENGTEVLQNASMKGTDNYAISIGKVGKSGQKLVIFTEKGRFATHNIVF